jgi:DNA-binding NarL/FixJ family response regulator
MSQKQLHILIADDYDIVREGMRAVIERRSGWKVCGLARTGREAVEIALSLKPDIVVMDMSMPELNGVDATRQIRRQRPETEVLIFTAHETDDLIRDAFEAGAKGFVNKAEAPGLLIEALESLSQHKPFFAAKVSEILFSNIVGRRAEIEPGQRLSGREREVVQLLVDGKSNKEVAEALGVSVRTAETHRASILRKLNLDSIASLVRYAIRNHLIEP